MFPFVKRKQARLITKLTPQRQATGAGTHPPSKMDKFKAEMVARLTEFDAKYQAFIQAKIDPLMGKEREAHLQELAGVQTHEITPQEKYANYRLGLGGIALGAALLGQLVFAPLTILAIAVGWTSMWATYYFAYLQWRRTHRLGNVHLITIYITYLWLGGYATIGALGTVLLGIGLKIQAKTENQSRNNLINVFQLQPTKVWVRSNGLEVEIPFDQLQAGDTLVLYAGQVVPVDGTVIAGAATVDQHMLTGESQPAELSTGDAVMASTILLSGKLDVRVEKTGQETTAGQIGVILNQSAQYNANTALRVLELTDRYAVPTLVLSALSWPFLGAAGAISLLGANSTFCTATSSTLAILNYLNMAASRGVLIKDGSAFEKLNQVDTIVFDKTGTLTLGQPQVVQVHTLQGMSEDAVLALAAAAEARQTHPIARAIVTAAAERSLDLPNIDHAHYEAGFGIKVRVLERVEPALTQPTTQLTTVPATPPYLDVHVGSEKYMVMEGIVLPQQVRDLTEACHERAHSLVMIAVQDQLVGCIELEPALRPEVLQIVDGLRHRGLAMYIISGDQEAPTRRLAEELGMTGYYANTLPEAKADLVAQLQQQGRGVCFVGDGINDAIAMRKAFVSISLKGATTVATDTAQIVMMDGNLDQVLYVFQVADDFNRNFKRNFRFTTGVSLAAGAGVLLLGFTFAATEILYTVSLLGSIGIAMQPLLRDRNHKS